MKREDTYYYGCLIGGAIGDALGAPVETMSYHDILEHYGPLGVQNFTISTREKFAKITDDTQMSLFTAEGLLRSETRARRKEMAISRKEQTTTVFRAYLRWLYTQGLKLPHWTEKDYDGRLVKIKKLHAYRNPGVTCITSLGRGIMGTIHKPLNDSKGCGGVIRIAPVGLVAKDKEEAFELGADIGAITHGHPTAYLAAGTLATMIYSLIKGNSLEEAVDQGLMKVSHVENGKEVADLLEKAIWLASMGNPEPEKIESLGAGKDGHEVLAIAVYSALCFPESFRKAVTLAVNHSGDSDSTGAVTGNLLGTYLGAQSIPIEWRNGVELQSDIQSLSEDLLKGYEPGEAWLEKYPAW